MYNKYQFKKINAKKLLRHIKGRWVVVSLALLFAIGGGAAVTHADSINVNALPSLNNSNSFGWNNFQNNEDTWQNPLATNSQNSASSDTNTNKEQNTAEDIQQSANKLHDNILLHSIPSVSTNDDNNGANIESHANAESYTNPLLSSGSNDTVNYRSASASSEGAAQNTNHAIQGSKFYYSSKEINSNKSSLATELFNNEAPSPFSMPTNMVASDVYDNAINDMKANKPSNNVVSDLGNTFMKNGIFGGSNLATNIYNSLADYSNSVSASISANASKSASDTSNSNYVYGTYAGMTYKYDKATNGVEFTGGTMERNRKLHADTGVDWKMILHYSPSHDDGFVLSHGGRHVSYVIPHEVNDATSIKIDSDVDTSKITNAYTMFHGDPLLRSVELPKNFGPNVINAEDMFMYDVNLHSVKLPVNFGPNIHNVSGMFYGDYNLQSMTLPSDFGKHASDADEMFAYDRNLQSINLPTAFGKDLNIAQGMFSHDPKLHSINLPVDFSPDGMSGMFESDYNLRSLNLPKGFGQKSGSVDDLFKNDYNLQSITLPAGFGQYATDTIGLFENDHNLKSLNLPKGFGQGTEETQGMFANDSSLRLLKLPADFGQFISYDDSFKIALNDPGFNTDHSLSLVLPRSINSSLLYIIKRYSSNINIIWEHNN